MKFWVTKYALTQGIQEVEAEYDREYPGMLTVPDPNGYYPQHFHGKDWHRTREAAVEQANKMVRTKIDSIKKQLKRLESLTF